jgi:hypothetical protein
MVEGLVSSEPGLGEPLESQDPLAGLSILEDDRLYVHDADPLAGLGGAVETEPPPPAPQARSATPPAPVAPEPELDETEEEEDEQFDEDAEQPMISRSGSGSNNSTRARARVVEEAEAEEQVPEEREAPKRPAVAPSQQLKTVKPTRPKLVPPTAQPRKKTPSRKKTPEVEQSGQDRRPVNPFQRKQAKEKPRDPSPVAATPKLSTPPAEVPRAPAPKEPAAARARDDNFVDLADWLHEGGRVRSTRMIAEEDRNFGENEQVDFTHMLEKFKAGIAANIDEEDYDSHYDLGIAYKEMGLVDEAVAEFQKALRGAAYRIRAYEALGQCFIDRNEFDVAITVLSRALREQGMEDEDLIGVLYLLGFASEESRKPRDAAAYYQRVFAIDIDFRDVSKRLKQMSKAASK